jgi:glycerophosphoryl diester phosphodiesterase
LVSTKTSPLIIGHRGASSVAPENTLSAFARAVRDGADGIELDVRLSRDGVPVVIHDATLPRTRLRKRFVARMTLAKLRQTDLGSWFNQQHPDLARLEYTRQTIPTLDEVFQLLANQAPQRFTIYVELKCGHSRNRNEQLASATADTVQRHGLKDQAILISFNLRTVARIKQLDGSLRTGALFGQPSAVKSPLRIVQQALACDAHEILLNHRVASQKLVAAANAKGLTTVVWTVDDPRWISHAKAWGIHALMTNDPAKFLKASNRL